MASKLPSTRQMIKELQLCDLKDLLKAVNVSFKSTQKKALLLKKCLECSSLPPDLVKQHYENYKRRRDDLIAKRQSKTRGNAVPFIAPEEPELQQEEDETLADEAAIPTTLGEVASSSAPVNATSSTNVDSSFPAPGSVTPQNQHQREAAENEAPILQFRKSPFFEVQAVLLPLKVLVSSVEVQDNPTVQQASYKFTFSPEQNAEYLKGETEVQLRFCKNDPVTLQDDRLPLNLEVTVNAKVIYRTPKSAKSVPLDEPESRKSPSAPLTITNAKMYNSVHVSWGCNNPARSFALGIFLVKKVTAEALVQQLEGRGALNRQETMKLIKATPTRSAAEGDEVNATGPKTIILKASVCCPIGKQRMTLPIRSKTCSHVQCFDAKTFLEMWERKPYSSSRCPVCNDALNFDDLWIDGYFVHVLKELSPRVGNVVELLPDGNWSASESTTRSSSSSTHRDNPRASTSRSSGDRNPIFIDLALTPFTSAIPDRRGSESPEIVDLMD